MLVNKRRSQARSLRQNSFAFNREEIFVFLGESLRSRYYFAFCDDMASYHNHRGAPKDRSQTDARNRSTGKKSQESFEPSDARKGGRSTGKEHQGRTIDSTECTRYGL